MANLRKVYRTQVDTILEMKNQTRAERRRSDDNDLKIQELEAALRNLRALHTSDCKGECKEVIRLLEHNLLRADEEIELLIRDVRTEKERCWGAEEVLQQKDVNLAERERLISQLGRENDLLIKRYGDCQGEIQAMRMRLMKEIERKDATPRYMTPETVKNRSESDLGEPSDEREYYRRGAKPKKGTERTREGPRRRTSARIYPTSQDESDPEWTEVPRSKDKKKKDEVNYKRRSEEQTIPHASAKSIKALRSMLPSFSKSDKTGSILEHLSLYQRLMQTLEMDSDAELRTYLSWTFASDSQTFFLSVNSQEYDSWAEYRGEVIKYFSPHRNTHEALRHALNLKCEFNQHPRDYLQLLKNAFAQVQKGGDIETKQFRDAYFYGLPLNIRTQLARDYDDNRSIDWIYKQAKSVYDVSRTAENTEPKEKSKPSKVCEVNKEKELPFEAGGAKPRPAPKEKEQQRSPEQKAPNVPSKEPEPVGTISPRYKGNNPIPNFVYKPKEKPGETRWGGDGGRPIEKENKEREPYYSKPREQYYPKEREYYSPGRQTHYPQNRERNAQDSYRQGSGNRPDYQSERREQGDSREWQDTRPCTDNRDRYQPWDTRSRSPRQPDRMNALEEQLEDLSRQYKKLLTKDSGLSPRVQTATSGETQEQDTPRPGQ